ncbi:MAG: phosphoglucomutase/phosphomannomutase family protein [Lachnospirales bacterium]
MIKFGTGGWREIIGDKFTKNNIRIIATALTKMMKDENKQEKGFIVGYDRRFLSKEACIWISEIMAGQGIKTFIVPYGAPTPLIMYAVKDLCCDYGAIVTASHNPAIYNGIKLFTRGGKDANEVVTAKLETYINSLISAEVKILDFEKAKKIGLIEEINPQNKYIDSIINWINLEEIKKRNIKIVLDPMYGVSKNALLTILLTSRCYVDVINENHDTLFGGRIPAPSEKALKALKNNVIDKKADIGIATDGDADRVGVIDENGNFLHPNKVLVLIYYYLLNYKGLKGGVVRNIATTHLLDKIAKARGEKAIEVPVGFKHITKGMEDIDAIIGGESSGGLTIASHIKGKDGILASAVLVEMIAVTKRSLSDIYKEITSLYGDYYMVENQYEFTAHKKNEMMNTLFVEKRLPEFFVEVEKVSYLDGVKVYFKNDGWIIIRFSGTEPLLRIFCEMSTIDDATKICNIVEKFLDLRI